MRARAWPMRSVRHRRLWLAVALLVLAAWMEPLMLPQPTRRFLFTFDVTQSMGVTDMAQDDTMVSRLAFAKATALAALRDLPCGSEVGWAVFADHRSIPLLSPLEVCAHFNVLRESLDQIDTRHRWASASHVEKGLYWSLRVALSHASSPKAPEPSELPVVVFFSDGQEAPPVAAVGGTTLVVDAPVAGMVVGVGQSAPSPIPHIDVEGRVTGYWRANEVVQRVDLPQGASHEELSALAETHLQTLARRHGLAYQRLTQTTGLAGTLQGLGTPALRPVPTDLRWLPGVAALGLLVWPFVGRVAGRAWRGSRRG